MLAIGDSIANGLTTAGAEDGGTFPGKPPRYILAHIEAMDPEKLKGQQIVLSSGTSNNTADAKVTDEEIKVLIAKGVRPQDIHLLGVGTRSDINAREGDLSDIAARNGVKFVPWNDKISTADGVHPSSYKDLMKLTMGAQTPLALGEDPLKRASKGDHGMFDDALTANTNRAMGQQPAAPTGSDDAPQAGGHNRYESQDGLSEKATRQVQEMLKGKYDLGTYGDGQGKDGKDGELTHFAFSDEKKHLIDAGLLREGADIKTVLAAIKADTASQQANGDPHPGQLPAVARSGTVTRA